MLNYFEELDALSLEYKRDYGTARRNLNVSDFVNNPNSQGTICVFGHGFSEKIADISIVKLCMLSDDRSNSALILQNTI